MNILGEKVPSLKIGYRIYCDDGDKEEEDG